MNEFSTRLRTLRKGKKLTQKQLGDRVGVTVSVISSYEQGMRRPPYETLLAFAKEFHVSTDYLLGKDPISHLDSGGLTQDQIAALSAVAEQFREANA